MKFKTFIGIDVSKLSLDVCLITDEGEIRTFKVDNSVGDLRKLFRLVSKDLDIEKTLVCAEFTGHYSNILKAYCLENKISLWLESGAEIKLRSGVQRRKTDKVDAERIAEYAMRYTDKAQLQALEDIAITESKLLLSERQLYIGERAKYKTQLRDMKKFVESPLFRDRSKRLKKHIAVLDKSIKEIDQKIKELLKTKELAEQKKILTSIPGVGDQVAINTIVATNGFKKFKNGRKFACHVGVAPFSFQSGTSQRSRDKVSHRANKRLKTLFHMAALSAVKMQGEFRDYFERKVAEGKNKMTVINAVRAKIINRIFALIRENRKYKKNHNLSLVNP